MVVFPIKTTMDGRQALRENRKVQKGLSKTEAIAGSLRNTLKNAFVGIGFGLLARKTIQTSDAFTALQNRLRLVTKDEENLRKVTLALGDSARDTRTAFTDTAELYARVARSAGELGRSQEELLAFTTSVNQAIKVSGATGTESSAGLIQFAQGLAAGALRGDELRSVMEQLPAVADVIRKSLGQNVQEFRAFGKQGKITADIVLDAFAEAREELADRFATTIPTVSDSINDLGTEFTLLVGDVGASTGAFEALSRTLSVVADGFKLVRRSMSGFRDLINKEFDEAPLSSVGATINILRKELEALEKREIINDDTLARINQLKTFLGEAADEAKEITKALPEPEKAAKPPTKEDAKAEKERLKIAADRANAIRDVVLALREEADVNRLILSGQSDLIPALETVNSLRDQGIEITAKERDALLSITSTNQALEDQAQAYLDLVEPQQEVNRRIETLRKLMSDFPDLTKEATAEIDRLRLQSLEAATDMASGFERAFLRMKMEANDFAAIADQALSQLVDTTSDALADMVTTGEDRWRELAESILEQITRIITRLLILKAIEAGLSALGGDTANLQTAQTAGNTASGALQGSAQFGAQVQPGQRIKVGEGGPEEVAFGKTGVVVPNARDQAANVQIGGPTIVNVTDPREIANWIDSPESDQVIINKMNRLEPKLARVRSQG